jgi:hypothetical protein
MRVARNNRINFPLVCWENSFSFLFWPNCRNGWWAIVLSAADNDVIYSVGQFAINRENNISIFGAACAREYGGGRCKILKMITKYGGTSPLASWAGSRWSTMDRIGSQPEAVKDRADIGPQLSMLGVGSCNGLLSRKPCSETSSDSGADNKYENRVFEPVFGFSLGAVLIALGGWLTMFTARHRGPLFLVFATLIFVGGMITMLFADLIQSFFLG